MSAKKILLGVVGVVVLLAAAGGAFIARGRVLTLHPVQPSSLGASRSSADLLALIDQPGEWEVETVSSVDWVVDRKGLINLRHPRAEAAGLKPGDEPITLYFHALRHPTRGLFIVDTGMERAVRDQPDQALVHGALADKLLRLGEMKHHNLLGDWLTKQPPLTGVFLTHLHLDHISGMRDVPATAQLYAGPGDARLVLGIHALIGSINDLAFSGKGPIHEWRFEPDASGRFSGVIDVFGDGQVWALWMPGHTPGSTAYLVRTTSGPVLMVGDTCHSAWGWENDVEPGEFTVDQPGNAVSLQKLRQLAKEHPAMKIRLGHQPLKGS
jgi:N-acyl homoserine lactone hydrolase